MALQLAWYKTRETFTATYETALTRAFDKARTETIRTLTEDGRAWVLSMTDPTSTVCLSLFHTSARSDHLPRPRQGLRSFVVRFRLTPPSRARLPQAAALIDIYSASGS
jgi:hypothetical protein